jgi:ribonuclease D
MKDFLLTGPAVDAGILTDIASRDRIGLDTEFMREKTYFSQLCLLQVSTPEAIFCIDPLDAGSAGNGPDDVFWEKLAAPEWVVHSARQDIEVIYHTSGCMPQSVFDTQVAAALLGLQPQIGYAGLVETLFGVELEKTHTRADWSKRPLRRELLEYAAEDVEYLLPAWDELQNRLEEMGRLQWAIEDSADLLSPSLYSTDPTLAIERLKGARNLSRRSHDAARRLAAWREAEALRTNRPRQWIMRDAVLIDIAVTNPGSRAALAGIEGMAERTVHRVGSTILGILSEASGDNSSYQPPRRPTEAQKAALKAMQKLVAGHAADLGIAAEVLAPRKELAAAMQGERDTRVFRGWRRDLFGERLLELLERG